MIAEPPVFGATKATEAEALPRVAVGLAGADGTVLGVTAFDAALAAPVPMAFVAVTVNVYAVPLVRPVTVSGDAAPVPVAPPGLAVRM